MLNRNDPELERAALAEGYDDVVTRPVSRRRLVAKVHRLLAEPDPPPEPTRQSA